LERQGRTSIWGRGITGRRHGGCRDGGHYREGGRCCLERRRGGRSSQPHGQVAGEAARDLDQNRSTHDLAKLQKAAKPARWLTRSASETPCHRTPAPPSAKPPGHRTASPRAAAARSLVRRSRRNWSRNRRSQKPFSWAPRHHVTHFPACPPVGAALRRRPIRRCRSKGGIPSRQMGLY
jgi:hypothetical protein